MNERKKSAQEYIRRESFVMENYWLAKKDHSRGVNLASCSLRGQFYKAKNTN